MSETTTFSASGSEAITRTIHIEEDIPTSISLDELIDIYDIIRTAEQIEQGDYKRVKSLIMYTTVVL